MRTIDGKAPNCYDEGTASEVHMVSRNDRYWPVVATANALLVIVFVVWRLCDPSFRYDVAAPLALLLFVATFALPDALRAVARSAKAKCELCGHRRRDVTVDTAWAEHYGLTCCHQCSFKMHMAFGEPDEHRTPRVLH